MIRELRCFKIPRMSQCKIMDLRLSKKWEAEVTKMVIPDDSRSWQNETLRTRWPKINEKKFDWDSKGSREPNTLVDLQRWESKNGGCVVREDSVQLEDYSNKMRGHQEALHLGQKDDKKGSSGRSWLAPAVLVWIVFASEFNFPGRKSSSPAVMFL